MGDNDQKTVSTKHSKSFLGTYFRLLGEVKPYAWYLAGAILCMIVLALTTGLYAYVIGPMLKFLVSKGEAGGQEILSLVPGLDVGDMDQDGLLMALPVFILVVAFVKGISYFGQFYLMGLVGQRVVADLRVNMFRWLTALSPAFFNRTPTGQIISRFTSDVYAVEQAVTYSVASYLRDTMQIVVLTILAFVLDWQLALIAFVVMPVAIFPIVHFGKKLKRVSTDSQVTLGSIADRLHEGIKGMRIIQVFGTEDYERRRFGSENRNYLRIMLRSFAVRALQSPVMEFLGAAGLAAIIWYSGSRIADGTLDPGHFVSFFAAVMMLYNPMKSLGRIGGVTAAGVAAAERVFELLDEPKEVVECKDAVALVEPASDIVFENVHFNYGSEDVLRGVSFKAERGEVIAIVGPSGAGKSTLVNLIPRFYDVSSGRIMVGGKNIRDLTLASLRDQIGMVTQEVVLFNDTVANNIAYGMDNIDDNVLREVAIRAHAFDFIKALPKGFETSIGEGGIRLSGGQRQRIAIARALMKDAPVLILDEATSSLDTKSEREVQAALDALMHDRTTIVIAHRLSTIYRANRILVLDAGTIVEEGKHESLLERGGIYRRLYDLQFEEPTEAAEHE
ncbi:MAG: ATP-binding cassette domain-containing protein [Deltaproteobacteria bacterium]|nr:ATP-binding cassette domain-containing protein [Deltaproteobacteria bacterium]